MTKEYLITARVIPFHDDHNIYRIYLDDDLITERTFSWGKNCYIEENIFAELSEGQHYLKIETVVTDPLEANFNFFRIERISIDGSLIPMYHGKFSI